MSRTGITVGLVNFECVSWLALLAGKVVVASETVVGFAKRASPILVQEIEGRTLAALPEDVTFGTLCRALSALAGVGVQYIPLQAHAAGGARTLDAGQLLAGVY